MAGTPADPVATYRIQLTPDFTFAEVAGILPHLCELGVSHLYLSPVLEAMPGSRHGYDWCPPGRISGVLGGPDGYRLLREHARALGLGVILDIVPNHVGIADPDHNPWWSDVLVNGLDSRYAEYFDLDTEAAGGIVNLPYLGRDEDLADLRLDERGRLVLGTLAVPTAPGTASPGDDPHAVHARQRYRLVRHDSRRIGYRRFLAVNGLAALRQEVPEVYDATHSWLRELIADDLVDGVRVDHVDGLRDPAGYLRRLRADLGDHRLLYIEKGLAIGERLDPALPVDGTTGYDQLRLIEARFTAPTGMVELDETFKSVSGVPGGGDELGALARALRQTVLVDLFPDRLQRVGDLLCRRAPHVRAHLVQQAAALMICSASVARPDYPSLRSTVLADIERLRDANPILSPGFDVLRDAFHDPGYAPEAVARLGEAAVAVYGKATEDIGFHRTARLVSTQELGCNPRVPPVNRNDFHARMTERAARWPRALTALSTHDTKRSEDVRARIAVIAQTPQRWRILVDELRRIAPPPDPVMCYFLLQNVVGVWPDEGRPDADLARRLAELARKSMRENGIVSSWTDVDDAAESAVQQWLTSLQHGFAAELIAAFVALIADAGRAESISRKALSLLLPGVGDVYQGTEWWDHSLTDPDNRRPVDYGQRLDHPKLQAVRTALAVRRRHPGAFAPGGDFIDVPARGVCASHIVSFARGRDGEPQVVVVAVRLALMFTGAETRAAAQVELPAGTWRDAVTGAVFTGTVGADVLLGDGPLAVLEPAD